MLCQISIKFVDDSKLGKSHQHTEAVGDGEPSFNKARGKAILLGWNKGMQPSTLAGARLGISFAEKDLLVLWGSRLSTESATSLETGASWAALVVLSGARGMIILLCSTLARSTVSVLDFLVQESSVSWSESGRVGWSTVYEERTKICLV